MRAMTEIEWLDGRVTKVPELALGDAFGESVQAELDFGFDDVLEGLWVVVRHHEPDEDSDGDPRGRGCALHADCRYSLVEPSDLDRVFCILYEGQPRVYRAAGELGPPCVGTSFRASTASGLWHSPPRPPVPPGRRVSRLWQDDCTYICAFPVWEYVSAYAATGLHPQRATSLHGYGATRRRRPNGGRADHGRPRAMLLFLRRCRRGLPKAACICRPFFEIGQHGLKTPA